MTYNKIANKKKGKQMTERQRGRERRQTKTKEKMR